MNAPHRTGPTSSIWDGTTLLVAALVATLVIVGGVWLLAATSASWAVWCVLLGSISGTALLFYVVGKMLSDDDSD